MADSAQLPSAPWWSDEGHVRILLRRLPFTLALLATMFITGAVGGTMFHPITSDPDLLHTVGWGVPALRQGEVWTLVTSFAFTWQPWMLQTITLSILLFVLPLELVAGTKRTAFVFLSTQIGAYFLTALLISWPLAGLGSPWGEQLARVRDVGASAGAFGCAAALTWYLPRGLIRAGQVALLAYFAFWLLTTHRVWDVEHTMAGVIGFGIGWYWTHRAANRQRTIEALGWDEATTRLIMACAAFVIGLTNITSALLAETHLPIRNVATEMPGGFVSGSRAFVLLAGFLLILLARGLASGRRTAWLAGVILLEGTTIAHILKGTHVRDAIAASLAGLILATQSEAFHVQPDVPSLRRTLRSVAYFAAGFVLYAGVGLYALRFEFSPSVNSGEAIEEFFYRLVFLTTNNFHGDTERARWFLHSITLVWTGLIVYTVIVLLRPRLRPHEVSASDREQAERIFQSQGRTTTSPMTLWEGQTVVLSPNREAYLSYRLIGDVALVLGDPIGPESSWRPLVAAFLGQCKPAGWTACFYGITPRAIELFGRFGFATIQVAEDAIIWLEHLEFKGKKWQDVRSAINKANREGIRFEWFDQVSGDRAIRDQLWEISDAWLAEKGLPEMGFTLGKLTDPPDPLVRTAIAIDAAQRVHAFVTWLPVPAERGWVIDLMRRRPDAMKGAIEFLIAQSAIHFREEQARMLSLAAAPLAHIERPGEDVTTLQRGLDLIAERLDAFYHFAPLFEFKRKFDPAWSPLYLAYPGLGSLPKITIAVVRAYLPTISVPDLAVQLGAAAVSWPRRLIPVGAGTDDEPPAAPDGDTAITEREATKTERH